MAPQFPIQSGKTRLNDEWNITLDGEYARRVEDGCLVLWNSGLTIWLDQYGNDKQQSIFERIDDWVAEISADAQDITRGLDRFSYAQEEDDGVFTLNGFVFNDSGHLLIEMSMDESSQLASARKLFNSIKAA